jgi:hypothetical protein
MVFLTVETLVTVLLVNSKLERNYTEGAIPVTYETHGHHRV